MVSVPELKKHEDRCGPFYIRYDVEPGDDLEHNILIDADVWWSELDPKTQAPTFAIRSKWDGCTHLWMPYLHFDGLEQFDQFSACVKYIYEDLCDKHNVGE